MGISDHTLGIGVAIANVALGATVIEKHLYLSRDEGGVDLEPDEMKMFVKEANAAYQALGKIAYGVSEQEKKSLQSRRSLYIV